MLVVVVLAGIVTTVLAVALPDPEPPRVLGVIAACEQLADDVVAAGSFGSLTVALPRDWALVVGRYRAALAGAYDAGVLDVLDGATLGARSDRRTALLAGFEWCLTSRWLPAGSPGA